MSMTAYIIITDVSSEDMNLTTKMDIMLHKGVPFSSQVHLLQYDRSRTVCNPSIFSLLYSNHMLLTYENTTELSRFKEVQLCVNIFSLVKW